MNLRLLLLPLALLVISCSGGGTVFFPGRSSSASVSGSGSAPASNGYCQPRKHSCEHYDKELHKKNSKRDKIERYRQECAEYNQRCR